MPHKVTKMPDRSKTSILNMKKTFTLTPKTETQDKLYNLIEGLSSYFRWILAAPLLRVS